MTKVIYGLGNPGDTNSFNRHNIGWILVDRWLSSLKDGIVWMESPEAEIRWTEMSVGEKKVLFPRSERYMNDQGVTLKKFVKNNNIDTQNDLLIIYDDLDLPFGKFKLKKNNLSPTHNGVVSVCRSLRTKNIWALKIGVDNRDKKNRTNGYDYVLDNFTESELTTIDAMALEIGKTINYWIEDNFDLAFKTIKNNAKS